MDTPLDLYVFTYTGDLNCFDIQSHSGTKYWDDIVTVYLTIETN